MSSLNLRIVSAINERDDEDFASAALRRRILGLFSGPVRHVEVNAKQGAKLLSVGLDKIESELEVLVQRGKLKRRLVTGGPVAEARYSLPAAEPPASRHSAERSKTGERVVQVPKRVAAAAANLAPVHAARTAAWHRNVERVYQLIVERGRVCAHDVRQLLSCSQSTAWSILTTLEDAKRVTSELSLVEPGKNRLRVYRLATAASSAAAAPNQQEGTTP